MSTQIGDNNTAEKALEYFTNKMAFTTGPVELDSLRAHTTEYAIIDVRAEKDFLKEHIPGAISLPKNKWDELVEAGLSKEKLNVVYCYSQVCHLAANACIELAKAGYRVIELEGGFEGWKEHDFETESQERTHEEQPTPIM